MMMMKLTLLICFMVVLLQSDDGAAWRRRRRRRRAPPPPPCDKTACTWAWSPCSTTCGSGQQYARVSRPAGKCGSCNLPATRSCPGQPQCPPPPCDSRACTWAWSPCSTTCGSGQQSAHVTRPAGKCGSCNLPATRSCPGQPECPPPPCDTTDCKWSWSPCSATCDYGQQTAVIRIPAGQCGQQCYLPGKRKCPGLPECNQDRTVCPPCMWTWSRCSTTCGSGQQKAVLQMKRNSNCPSCDLPPTKACPGLPSCPDT